MSTQRPPQTVWFTMIYRGNKWVRVGPRYHRKSTAVSWLPFVAGATLCRAKATPCKLQFDANGDLTDETKQILDEQFNAEGKVMSEHAIKVGDQLAVPRRYGRDGWDIFTVSKITPTGRVYLSMGNVVRWVLNPDLTLRGDPCHRSAEPLTSNAIKRWLRRDGILQQIRKYDLDELPTATLEAVLKLLRGKT